MDIKYNSFTGKQSSKGPYLTKKRQRMIDRYKKGESDEKEKTEVEELMKLFEMSKQSKDINEQFQDCTRQLSRGVLEFSAKGMEYYNAIKILLIGSSGSGKSTNVLNLLLESPNSYEAIHLICPESSYNNETYTTLRFYCQKSGIKFFWTDSDIEQKLEFGDATQKDNRGSSKFLYDNRLPMFLIFDDCYKGAKSSHLSELMSDAFIKLRHRMVNTIIAQQSPNYIQSSVVLNWSHLFISGNFLNRDGIWDRLKIPSPENLNEMLEHYKNAQDKRHQFYMIKMDDSFLKPYTPYKFTSRNQIIQKFKYKLPKGITEAQALNMKKVRDEQQEQEETDDTIQDPTTYDPRSDIAKVYKDNDTIHKRNIKEIEKSHNENGVQKEKQKRKYIVRNGFKYFI